MMFSKLPNLANIFWWWLLHWVEVLERINLLILVWTPLVLRSLIDRSKRAFLVIKKLTYFFCSWTLQWYLWFWSCLFFEWRYLPSYALSFKLSSSMFSKEIISIISYFFSFSWDRVLMELRSNKNIWHNMVVWVLEQIIFWGLKNVIIYCLLGWNYAEA